jgi:ATP-dependent Clp protease ATP-binding subunit ClpA
LFVGPTGVGKTELAKILSEEYFGFTGPASAQPHSAASLSSGTLDSQTGAPRAESPVNSGTFIRFDMSEYQDPMASQKLIGASGQPGELTEAVRNKPYCLILLDEFEKGSPEILNLFLQVLDDGRLTDGLGQTIDFTNTIIIATSNAGSLTISNEISAQTPWELISAKVSDELLKVFKPELVNRFDSIVLFKPLSEEDMKKIVLLSLSKLQNQMLEQGYKITFSEELISELAKKGFDPTLGARPLRRLIQNTIETNLSKMILENQLTKGENFAVGVEML